LETLSKLLLKLDLAPFDVLRKADASFKELNLTKETPAGEIVTAILNHPNLLQRPIIEIGEKAILARPIEKALDFVKLNLSS
jgi:arsenate reductase (glutaredoxin)